MTDAHSLRPAHPRGRHPALNRVVCVLWVAMISSWPGLAAAGFEAGRAAYNRGDCAAALRAWKPLAEQGDAQAQFNLEVMYYHGEGVPQDDVQAYAWLNIAAAQGDKKAAEPRDRVGQRMTQDARAQRLAQQYWEAYVLPFRN